MPVIHRPVNENDANDRKRIVLTNKSNIGEKKQPVLVKKSNSVVKNKNDNNMSLSNETGNNKKSKSLVADVKNSNNQSKSPSVGQLNNNKKSNGSQFMPNAAGVSLGVVIGFLVKKHIYDRFFGEDKSGIIVNSDLVSYFRKKFDTKPKSWRFSPRYYFIKFLNMLFKYNSNDNKITDEYITLIVKYGLLAFMPTSKNPVDEQMFGSLVATILQELNYYSDFGKVVKWFIKIAGKNNAELARKWGTAGVKDTDFLQAKQDNSTIPPFFAKNHQRLNWVVGVLGLTKERFGKYFENISNNIKRYMNLIIDECRDETPGDKLVLDVNDDFELSQSDKDEIAELLKDNNIDENVKRLIVLGGYQLALVFSNLLIRIAISQSFEIGMAEVPKN